MKISETKSNTEMSLKPLASPLSVLLKPIEGRGQSRETISRIADLTFRSTESELKWSQKTGQLAKVYPKPMKGYENGEAPEFYRSV